jgi:hypothetical protein
VMEIPDDRPLPATAFERQRVLVSEAAQLESRGRLRNRGALAAIVTAAIFGALLVAPIGIGSGLLDLIRDPSLPSEASFRPSVEERHAGQTWTAGLATNGPETCVELRSPSGQRSGSCYSASDLTVLGPIRAYSGGIGDVRFLYGTAAPTVKTLKVVRSDCSVQTLDVAPDGVFLSIDSSSAPSPFALRGYDAAGSLVNSNVLHGSGPSGSC